MSDLTKTDFKTAASPIKEKITRWSLERVRFLLSHIEGFIDDENAELRDRALAFTAQGGLDKIERLVESNPSDPVSIPS
ncbi:MAG: hypothetical protein HC902_10265, partial [Calothrix sp. SM1_5_4]|nr:hypothetical protein [Calothrix sp. SM1_5_4]